MLRTLLMAAIAGFAVTAQVASAQDPMGYQALLASFSAAELPPPGKGVVLEQVEASTNYPTMPLAYMPNTTQSNYSGVTFIDETKSLTHTAGTTSDHSNNVASHFYGTSGYASGAGTVDMYEANYWLADTLNVASPTHQLPAVAPSSNPANPAVANFSWISTGYGSSTLDNDALSRFDWMIDQDNLVAVVAVNDNGSLPPLMAGSYNSIAVGLYLPPNGSSTGPVPPGDVDGPGRSKPDIVAPEAATSYAAPDVSAAAAMLVQVARSNTTLSAGTNAAVIRAILMAGADKNPLPSWSQPSGQTLDPQYGAGQLNFEWAYQIMNAGPQAAGSISLAASTGWSFSSLNPSNTTGHTNTYYFDVPSGQPVDLSALLTWSRTATYALTGSTLTFTPSVAAIVLNLYQANSNFSLGSLVASSSSSVDNVQYVFDRGLAPGEYALQVARSDTISGAWSYALAWQLQSVPQWAFATNGSWNNAGNWTTGMVPNGVSYEAVLDASTTAGVSVTLDAPQIIGQLTLGNMASAAAGYTISAGASGTLTFSNSAASALVNIATGSHAISAPVILAGNLTVSPSLGAALDISGNISETGGSQLLTLNGPGLLALAGSNTFSGGITISAGTLQIGAGGASGTPGGGAITDNATLVLDRSDTYTMPVGISGSGSVVQLGLGTTVLAASNSYTGTTVISGGALRAALNVGLPSASSLTLAGGVLESSGVFTRAVSSSGASTVAWTAAGGGFSANGTMLGVNLFGNGQTLAWSGSGGFQGPLMFGSPTANNKTYLINPINLSGADRTIQVTAGQGGDLAEIDGGISNSAGTAGVIKTGNGLLVLAGNNTYNGKTTIAAGTLEISSSSNLGSGGLVFSGSGTGVLEVAGSTKLTASNTIALSQNGTFQQNDSAPVILTGPISVSGELIKSGSGLLELSATDSYTGKTIVLGGTLMALNKMALPSGGGLIIGANAPTLFGGELPAISSADSESTDGYPPSAGSPGGAGTLFIPIANSSTEVPAASAAGANAVPEPNTLLLLLVCGAGGLLWHVRRRSKSFLRF